MLRDLDDYLRELDFVEHISATHSEALVAGRVDDDDTPILFGLARRIPAAERAALEWVERERAEIQAKIADAVAAFDLDSPRPFYAAAVPIGAFLPGIVGVLFGGAVAPVLRKATPPVLTDLHEQAAAVEARAARFDPGAREAWDLQRHAAHSQPALPRLTVLSPSLARRFKQRARIEAVLGDGDDYSDLIRGQVVDWEEALRGWFLQDVGDIAAVIVESLDSPGQRAIVEKYLSGGFLATLGLTQIWLTGYRRALAKGDPAVVAWTGAAFEPRGSRHDDEALDTRNTLLRKAQNVARFVDVLREKFRNPLAHGAGPDSAADQAAFCDLAYGTRTLGEWLEIGTNPRLHTSKSFGWLSFLCFTRRIVPGAAPSVGP